ncbi:MAG: A/G-specific adenine glycosylase [Planctomycetaceae bacterium]
MPEMDFDDWFHSRQLTGFRTRLKNWYRKHGRQLPWRESHNAYRIWISEIMLQQTTVAAVIPYFERFLARFPTLEDLANAQEQDVLQLWEGLGYYSRARNIHRAARMLVEQYGGQFPQSVSALQTLPGIGRYTAGAIASFAFDLPAPIVEANTLRLYSRLLGYADDPRTTAAQKQLWNFAGKILPRNKPGLFNQALMELGSTICRPVEPRCEQCPVKSYCRAFRMGKTDHIPKPKTRPSITAVTEVSIAVKNRGRYLVRRYREKERWAGLWDFPRFELADSLSHQEKIRLTTKLRRQMECDCQERFGIQLIAHKLLTELFHSVTRYRIRLLCLFGEYQAGEFNTGHEHRWITPVEFADFPFSVTGRKFANLLAERDSALM